MLVVLTHEPVKIFKTSVIGLFVPPSKVLFRIYKVDRLKQVELLIFR